MPDAQRSTDLEGIDATFATAVAWFAGGLPIEPSWPVTNGDGTDWQMPTADRIPGEHVEVADWPQPGLVLKTSEEDA